MDLCSLIAFSLTVFASTILPASSERRGKNSEGALWTASGRVVGERMASQWWRFRCTIRQIERGKVTRGSAMSERKRSSERKREEQREKWRRKHREGRLTKLNYKSYELSSLLLRASYPLSATLFRLTPLAILGFSPFFASFLLRWAL